MLRPLIKSDALCFPFRYLRAYSFISIELEIFFFFVYDGCESRLITSREEHKYNAFNDVVVRKAIQRKKVEITEMWRK